VKTVVVGDLHGQVEIVDTILNLCMPTIFIGDYMDSFHRNPEDQAMTLMKVLSAVKESEDIQALIGNHELSYLYDEMVCSGYNTESQTYVNLLSNQMALYLDDYIYHEGFLLSHAGISQELLDATDQTLDVYLDEGNYRDIGRARGGRAPVGGLYWCDWNHEFEPVRGVSQIVGHTNGLGIRKKGSNNYCIDCLESTDKAVLFIEDGKAEIVPLEELE